MRGWDLNPLPLLKTRNLLILRCAQYAKNAQSANRATWNSQPEGRNGTTLVCQCYRAPKGSPNS